MEAVWQHIVGVHRLTANLHQAEILMKAGVVLAGSVGKMPRV